MSAMSQPGSQLIEFALEKSRSAVNRDSGVGDKDSLKMYKEAVDALQNVLDDDADHTNNKSRLKTIVKYPWAGENRRPEKTGERENSVRNKH